MPEFMKQAIIGLTERHSDPMAGIKLQEAYKYVSQVGKLMAGVASEDQAKKASNMLLSAWTEDEVDLVNYHPAFIMALCGLLSTSLINYTRYVANDPSLSQPKL